MIEDSAGVHHELREGGERFAEGKTPRRSNILGVVPAVSRDPYAPAAMLR